MDIIKTSGGVGSPGYVDDNAPNGGQWQSSTVPPVQLKVPEGTQVKKTGRVNDYTPPFIEIDILSGAYIGKTGIWVKSTHVVTVEDPTPPPIGEDYAYQIDVQAKIMVRKVKIEG